MFNMLQQNVRAEDLNVGIEEQWLFRVVVEVKWVRNVESYGRGGIGSIIRAMGTHSGGKGGRSNGRETMHSVRGRRGGAKGRRGGGRGGRSNGRETMHSVRGRRGGAKGRRGGGRGGRRGGGRGSTSILK
nr:hypothetical protein [Tanacetum cinerariifolium]